MVDGIVVVANGKLVTIAYDAALEETRGLSEAYSRDSSANRARLDSILP